MGTQMQRAVVTGGGSGLGRAFCLELAKRGARVLVADVNRDGAEKTASEAKALGAETIAVYCDVAKIEDVENLAAQAEKAWGGTDFLINNAGVAVGGHVGEVSLDDWKWIVGINLWGALHGCHVFIPRFKKQGIGAILNVASSAGFVCTPEMSAYNVTKAGIIALSETLYAELAPHHIGVTVLCPTFVRTNIMSTFRASNPQQEKRHRAFASALFERSRMTAEEVARVTLMGVEDGKLYVVPQADGKWLWRLKRFFPGPYAKILARLHKGGFLEKLLKQNKP